MRGSRGRRSAARDVAAGRHPRARSCAPRGSGDRGRARAARASPSSSTFSPIRAQPTWPARWKSPTDTASGSPSARCATSAAVQTPTPGRPQEPCAASSCARPVICSRRPAAEAARITVRDRDWSTPARCHSHDGTRAHASAPAGPAGPGRTSSGPGRRLAVPAHEQPPPAPGLVAGDLLLEDGRGQRLQHETGARHPPAGVPAPRLADHRVVRHEAGRVVAVAEQRGQRVEGPLRARPPGGRLDHAVGRRQPEPHRRRPGRRAGWRARRCRRRTGSTGRPRRGASVRARPRGSPPDRAATAGSVRSRAQAPAQCAGSALRHTVMRARAR